MRESTKEKEEIKKNPPAKSLLVVGILKATENSTFQKFSLNFCLENKKIVLSFQKRSHFDHFAMTNSTFMLFTLPGYCYPIL